MTKLEEKLKELGYEKEFPDFIWEKFFTQELLIKIDTRDLSKSRVFPYGIYAFKSQQDINDLQQAFNQMQKDLEELRKYEKI